MTDKRAVSLDHAIVAVAVCWGGCIVLGLLAAILGSC